MLKSRIRSAVILGAAALLTGFATSASAATQAKPKHSVEYIVTGTKGGAQVTYGPAGSDFNGHVPMHVIRKLHNPAWYAITAQLQGGGHVKCEIKVNGKTISTGTARGGFNIAMCEISKNPITGKWENDN
jgi:hypothetical protein